MLDSSGRGKLLEKQWFFFQVDNTFWFIEAEWKNYAVVDCHITTDRMFPFFDTTKPMNLNSKFFQIFCICIINV